MAVELFKLAIEAESSIVLSPDIENFFYLFDPGDVDETTGLTIEAADFVDDAGDPITSITEATTDNGYYQLFINGVLQQEGLYTVTTANVTIPTITDSTSIPENAPITLIVTNFVPVDDITVNT